MRGGVAWVLPVALAVVSLACRKKTDDVVVEPDPAPVTSAVQEPAEYAGTSKCASCHETEYESWLGSHHDLAMQKTTPETVLGNLNNLKVKCDMTNQAGQFPLA